MKIILNVDNTNGKSVQFLKEMKAGKIFKPQDIKKIENELIIQYTNWEKQIQPKTDMEKINSFTRKNITEKLAGLFDQLI